MIGWILRPGRKNGVSVTDVQFKGTRVPLEFRSDSCRGLIQGKIIEVLTISYFLENYENE